VASSVGIRAWGTYSAPLEVRHTLSSHPSPLRHYFMYSFLKRSAYFVKSHRVRTICARVRNYGASPRSESCSSVRGMWGLMRARWHASLLKSSSTIIAPSYRRISIHEIVRRSQLDSPWCRLCTHNLYSQRLHPIASTL
jgi:hypothetical protein